MMHTTATDTQTAALCINYSYSITNGHKTAHNIQRQQQNINV